MTTTPELSPEVFRDELDRATDSPPPAGPGRELVHGRRLLRRRRAVTVGASALVTMVLAGGVAAVGLGDGLGVGRDRGTQVADHPPAQTTDYLDSCRSGNQSDVSTAAVFDAGTPIVRSVARTDFQVVLALESADGSAWAECWIHLKSAEFASGMTVYSAQPADRRTGTTGMTSGLGCAMTASARGSCRSWFASTVDRLPAEVAAVRYGLGDGTEVTVPSQDGFVVLNVLGTLPAGVTVDIATWGPGGFDPITTTTYLDSTGAPLASEGPDAPAGLPRLKAYPSLKGQEIY